MADDAAAPDQGTSPTTVDDPATDVASADTEAADDPATDDPATDDPAADTEAAGPSSWSHVTIALVAGLIGVVALAALTGWLGWRTWDSHRAEQQRAQFLQVGRQGALDLTTIDYRNADADVQRILDSATGTFYDDFQKRAQPFVQVVKQARSTSVGTVAEAGLLSSDDDEAQVLVAVTVKSSNAGTPEQEPRAWRMRITVEKIGDDAKVSNVDFVA